MINNKNLMRIVGAATIAAAMLPSLASAAMLTRQLEVGSTGSDVSTLQSFLAQDPVIYPQGLVTGRFLSLTKAAVMNFQSHNDIPVVGRVGPITLGVINAQMAGGVATGADVYAPTITNVNVTAGATSASVKWNTSEYARGIVYYSTSPLMVTEYLHSVSISGNTAAMDTNLNLSQNVNLSSLSTNTTYYYMVYATDAAGNVSVSLPSTFKTSN